MTFPWSPEKQGIRGGHSRAIVSGSTLTGDPCKRDRTSWRYSIEGSWEEAVGGEEALRQMDKWTDGHPGRRKQREAELYTLVLLPP